MYMSINPLLNPGGFLLEYSSRAAFVSRIFIGNECNLRAFPQGYTSRLASVSDASSTDVNWSQMKIAPSRIESRSRQARTNRMGKIGCCQKAPDNLKMSSRTLRQSTTCLVAGIPALCKGANPARNLLTRSAVDHQHQSQQARVPRTAYHSQGPLPRLGIALQ